MTVEREASLDTVAPLRGVSLTFPRVISTTFPSSAPVCVPVTGEAVVKRNGASPSSAAAELKRYDSWLGIACKELDNIIKFGEKLLKLRKGSGAQEMHQSFNLQYLQLQQNMQQQNRQFTMVSNIMKVKHDTAKAAINNIR